MSTYNHVQHVVSVNEFRSIADLNGLIGSNDGDSVYVAGYYESINDAPWVKGGGHFVWDSTKLRTEHNGVTIISPTVQWDNTPDTLADYHAGTLEIEPSGAGCWVRQYEVLNVHMAGAVGDGVVDDTVAIKSALNTGSQLKLMAANYKITSGLTINNVGQVINGEAPEKSIIIVSGSNYDAITITKNYAGVCNLSFFSNSHRSSGAYVRLNSVTRGNFVRNFRMQKGFIGVHISNKAVITFIDQGEILGATPTTGTGILIDGGNDTFISRLVMDSSGSEPNSGIRIKHSQAVVASDVDIINFGTPIRINPVGSDGDIVTWCFFSQILCDSSDGNGIEINPIGGAFVKGLFFDNCWSSTNNRGVYIESTAGGVVDTVHFTDCTFYNNKSQGVLISGSGFCSEIEFNNCRAAGNSTASSNVYSGFDINNNVTRFSIRGCRSGQHAMFPASQRYGILIGEGCDNYSVSDNNLLSNATASLVDLSKDTSIDRNVSGNLGFKTVSSGTATITSGLSSVTVNHGLSGSPTSVIVTPNANMGGIDFFADNFNTSTFSINTSSSVVSDVPFSWEARIYN